MSADSRRPHFPAIPVFWRLALILVFYLLLALAYGAVNPLFEAPDEHWHYFTAQTIAETGELPQVEEQADEWMGQEAAQPPLYYFLGSLLIRPFAVEGARETVWPNPFVQMGDASAPANRNAFVHGGWEAWPWQGYVLAAHLLRAFSALLGLGTLLFIYGSARLLWPQQPGRGLLATAMVAFLPQFIFLHSAISNDTLIVFLSAAALWQLLALWQHPFTRPRLLLLGITTGLAILSKTAGLLLLAYAFLFLLVRVWRRREPLLPALGKMFLFVFLPALLLSGWLLWRNWSLYGDPTAANQFVRVAGGDRDYTLFQVLAETPGLWTSFFAIFGWFNLRAPDWIYWLWNGLIVLAVVGAFLPRPTIVEGSFSPPSGPEEPVPPAFHSQRLLVPLLAFWLFLVYAGLVSFMLRTPAAQGRLLFPALLPLALGLAYGLDRLPWMRLLAPALALFTAVYVLLFVIPPAYAEPSVLPSGEIPPQARLIGEPLGQGIELAAVDMETREVQPGDVVWLTLYWRADPVPSEAPEMVLELFGRNGQTVGKLQSYHGGGLWPASLWPPERIVSDRVGVRLAEEAEAPAAVEVQLGLVGEERRLQLGSVKLVPEKWPEPGPKTLAELGDAIWLTEANVDRSTVRPGESLELSVTWDVREAPGELFATFVHLGMPGGEPLAQGDSLPLGGDYATIWWEPGEVIEDSYNVLLPPNIPPGRYPLRLGMYDAQTQVRLPLTIEGQRQMEDAYLVDWILVEP